MGKKLTQKQFLDKLQEVHRGKITTSAIYVNSSTKVTFMCETCRNTWTATPNSVMRGCGCPWCAGTKKKTPKEFIRELKRVHGDKITTEDTYVNNRTKMKFLCSICGTYWSTTPGAILRGHGCPECTGVKRLTQEEFLNKLFKVHGTNIKTTDTYTGNKDKIMFHCATCNYFWKATPNDMLRGYGCPRCGGNLRKTHEQFLLDLKRVHGDSINAVGEYTNALTKYVKLHPEYKTTRKGVNPTRVVAIDSRGVQHTYPSQSEAARQIGISNSCINCCLRGTQKLLEAIGGSTIIIK